MLLRNAAKVLVLLATLTIAMPALSTESVYTTLDFDNGSCKRIGPAPSQEDEDMGVVALLCPGYKGYPVQFNAGDERETVHYGDPAKATTESGWESFSPFNSVVDKVEWRLKDGVPFAAIQRFMMSTGEDEPAPGSTAKRPVKGQVLVISKVGQPGAPSGCVVGLVDALENGNANELARRIADDVAPGFNCGQDKAAYQGNEAIRLVRLRPISANDDASD